MTAIFDGPGRLRLAGLALVVRPKVSVESAHWVAIKEKTMKRSPTSWLLVPALALSAACAEPVPPAPDANAMIVAAGALDEQFLAAFNSRDVDAMAALYASGPDTVSFMPDVIVMRGSNSIQTSEPLAESHVIQEGRER